MGMLLSLGVFLFLLIPPLAIKPYLYDGAPNRNKYLPRPDFRVMLTRFYWTRAWWRHVHWICSVHYKIVDTLKVDDANPDLELIKLSIGKWHCCLSYPPPSTSRFSFVIAASSARTRRYWNWGCGIERLSTSCALSLCRPLKLFSSFYGAAMDLLSSWLLLNHAQEGCTPSSYISSDSYWLVATPRLHSTVQQEFRLLNRHVWRNSIYISPFFPTFFFFITIAHPATSTVVPLAQYLASCPCLRTRVTSLACPCPVGGGSMYVHAL